MRVCFQRETVVEGRLFEVDVNVEIVLNRPDNDIQALEMDVPTLYRGPIHHNTILLRVNSKMSSLGVNLEVSDCDFSDLEEAEEQSDFLRDQRGKHVVNNVRKLVKKLFADQV